MSKTVKFYVKDPDATYSAELTEEQREDIHENYAEFGEYFMIEVDFTTKTGRLLPRSEWKR